ncbi:cytochrome P450 [Streptomyces hirsutus]|uniref:cytochrome P450 n=1 Tax=Streptomyces hirsutus TaxID=35620 RepID=UPI0006E3A830|nr:cytochrome P450 [Streptomyces hirsutus]
MTPEQFDHTTEDHAVRWRDIYAEARRSCPVISSDRHGGYYVLTRHADITEALRNHQAFSSERSWHADGTDKSLGVAIPHQPVRVGILEMDPPEHTKYRRLLTPWFTRQAIARGRERIRHTATWAIDRIIEKGECDIVTDLAGPFQAIVILDVLGIPLERWSAYADVAERMVRQTEDRAEGAVWMREDVRKEVERQRVEPRPGLISGLNNAVVDGEPLSVEWATELVNMMLLGGEGTTIATIAHILKHLHDRPEDRARIAADPSLLPTAVDEMMRYHAPSPGLARTVTRTVEVGGHTFRPGDRVLLSYASGNYDEDVFPDAATSDITRSPNPHLAFGGGVHRCPGALLASANAEVFLGELLRRIPEYGITAVEAYERIPLTNGFYSMAMAYRPGAREGTDTGELPRLTGERVRPAGGTER